MRKLALLILVMCSCLCYAACSSHPVSGSCPIKDFNGDCCIRWSDCNLESPNPDAETLAIANGCHAIDLQMEPLLCLPQFNTQDLGNCVPLNGVPNLPGTSAPARDAGITQNIEACYGTGGGWDGANLFTYNVWCCK